MNDIKHISKEDMVKLIIGSGAKEYTAETLEDDIAKGLPLNDDGTINFFDYMAWLYDGRYLTLKRNRK